MDEYPDPPVHQIQSTFYARKLKTKVIPEVAVGLAAAGVDKADIATVFDVKTDAVTRAISNTPGAKDTIKEIRDKLKLLKISRINRLTPSLFDTTEDSIKAGDGKEIDAKVRAIAALEKVEVSLSGEAQRVDVTQINSQPTVDLKVLIANLLDDPKPPQLDQAAGPSH